MQRTTSGSATEVVRFHPPTRESKVNQAISHADDPRAQAFLIHEAQGDGKSAQVVRIRLIDLALGGSGTEPREGGSRLEAAARWLKAKFSRSGAPQAPAPAGRPIGSREVRAGVVADALLASPALAELAVRVVTADRPEPQAHARAMACLMRLVRDPVQSVHVAALLTDLAGQGGDTAPAARQALLALCTSRSVPDAFRQRVLGACERAVRAVTGAQVRDADLVRATGLTALAIQLQDSRGMRGMLRSLTATVRRLSFPADASNEDVLAFDRRIRNEEIIGETSKRLAACKVKRGVGEINLMRRGAQDSFNAALNFQGRPTTAEFALGALEMAARGNRPVTLFVNLDGRHWVTLVVFPRQATIDHRGDHKGEPAGGAGGTVSCVLFDSQRNSINAWRVQSALQQALAARGDGSTLDFRVTGGSLQGDTPNACGLLCLKAAKAVDVAAARQGPGAALSVEGVVGALEDWTQSWLRTTAADRRDQSALARAEVLMNEAIGERVLQDGYWVSHAVPAMAAPVGPVV